MQYRVAAAERLFPVLDCFGETRRNGTDGADVVINCAWTDRIRLDRMVDAASQDTPLSYRVKHESSFDHNMGQETDAVTMVQAPMGMWFRIKMAPYI